MNFAVTSSHEEEIYGLEKYVKVINKSWISLNFIRRNCKYLVERHLLLSGYTYALVINGGLGWILYSLCSITG